MKMIVMLGILNVSRLDKSLQINLKAWITCRTFMSDLLLAGFLFVCLFPLSRLLFRHFTIYKL